MWSYNYSSSELYHHGVLGMKWGVRRYQNNDGSLTSLGKSRRRKTTSNVTTKKKKQSSESEKKPKTIKDMSDEELSAATKRLKAENDYLNASKTNAELTPKKVSAGQKFVSTLTNKVLIPAATEATKKLVKDWLVSEGRKSLGLSGNDEDEDKNKSNKKNTNNNSTKSKSEQKSTTNSSAKSKSTTYSRNTWSTYNANYAYALPRRTKG